MDDTRSNHMKVQAFLNRRVPFYLLGASEVTDENGFDAYPVEVEDTVLANIRSVRRLVAKMKATFEEGAAPEDSAQAEADILSKEVQRIFKTRAQDNG